MSLKSNTDVSSLRARLGPGHYTILDDLIISWNPLSIADFFIYEEAFRAGWIASSVLEDEIFRKCVSDKEFVRNLDYLPAGTVSTVVQNILLYSGPASIDEFNDLLEHNRNLASTPVHQMAPLIVRAFPSYTLEAVYSMPYEQFIFRLAQAEQFLLKLGIIEDPISLVVPKQQKSKPKISPQELKTFWDERNNPKKVSILDKKHKNLEEERIAVERIVNTEDETALRATMIAEAANIYKDTLSKMDHYQKVKTPG